MTEKRHTECHVDCRAVLGFLEGIEAEVPTTLVVAGHPDDEVLGLGGQLARLSPRIHVLQVTDGAPHDMQDAWAQGFSSHQEYAEARRRELLAALALAGIGLERTTVFGIPDQRASLDLVALTRRLSELFSWLRPDCVIAPAYEGGHPDHDAAAFAVWAARALLRRAGQRVPVSLEFPLYHAGHDGAMIASRFVAGGPAALVLQLDSAQQERKRRMLECFASQQAVLAAFPVDVERFRCAAERDFLAPPHPGALHYDRHPWGMDGARWRRHATEALVDLELLPGAEAVSA
jgi:LmbE family N-acetylglucosaminyl deacetylase